MRRSKLTGNVLNLRACALAVRARERVGCVRACARACVRARVRACVRAPTGALRRWRIPGGPEGRTHAQDHARAEPGARTRARTNACTHARTHARMHACTHTRLPARPHARPHAPMHAGVIADMCTGPCLPFPVICVGMCVDVRIINKRDPHTDICLLPALMQTTEYISICLTSMPKNIPVNSVTTDGTT